MCTASHAVGYRAPFADSAPLWTDQLRLPCAARAVAKVGAERGVVTSGHFHGIPGDKAVGADMLRPVLSSPRDPRVDPVLIDSSLREEVDLLMRLIEAANASDYRLAPAVLDAVLFSDEPDATTPTPRRPCEVARERA